MTLLDTLLGRPRAVVPYEPPVIVATEQKAATGFGVTALTYSVPLWTLNRTPQQMAWQAAMLYADHDMIHKAESAVSGRAGNVEWHLEDENDDEVTDESAPALQAVRDLLEKPQGALPLDQRQPGILTSSDLWGVTLRHMGLCGTAFWHLDQTNALAGLPLALLYIAPWRMFPAINARGGLVGWGLDKPLDEGGTPLRIEDVLTFYLTPPERGYFASGLVQAAATKIPLSPLIDRHVAQVIGSGGRLTGLLSPKAGTTVTGDQWQEFVNDYRQITADPNAAQRLQIVQGPVDYVRTAATMSELAIVEISDKVNDDILSLWGVPGSQTGEKAPTGLNSGSTKGFDEAILWQGPISARLRVFHKVVQYGLLDRYKAAGINVELVLQPPAFDDDTPLWSKAQQAANLPLTRNERRGIVGVDPLPEWDADTGDPLGIAIDLPINLSVVGFGAFTEPRPKIVTPEPPPAPVLPAPPVVGGLLMPAAAKALLAPAKFAALRRGVDRTTVPKVKRSVLDVLQSQKAAIVEYLRRAGLEHLKRKVEFRWDARRADKELADAMKPELGRIAAKVADRTHAVFAAGKASAVDDFTTKVITRVLTKGAGRVRGINETTRDAVQVAVGLALENAETIGDVIDAVNGLDVFGELRAETIARTESMFAYNDAALGSYAEMGVEQVEAIDGDGDEECADRNGQIYSIEEAEGIEDHPNGTLDWAPVVPDEPEPPQKASEPPRMQIEVMRSDPLPIVIPAPIVNVPEALAPVVNIDTTFFVEALMELKAALVRQPTRKRVIRDPEGRIVEVIEE